MSTIIITLHTTGPKGSLDLELPGDVPLQDLLPELIRAVGLPSFDRRTGRPVDYCLELSRPGRRRVLRDYETLSRAGVLTGDILTLRSETPGVVRAPKRAPIISLSSRGPTAVLRCESGRVIDLQSFKKAELTVGRYNARTNQTPDIDLTNEPAGDTVSRSHALLRQQGPGWVLVPVTTRSPTLVDSKVVPPQQSCTLQPGQEIVLGNVKLVYEVR